MADLGGLDLAVMETAVTRNMQATGKPLEIPLADIAERPDNPRTEFDDEYLAELAEDIQANGVKSPVSIRANPTGVTPWVLNYGACRRRASLLADKQTIPAFIDEQFTDYDAVAENEQRRNLTAMELALFIQKRIEQGDKKKNIAEKLHKDSQIVTYHLALIDMPDAIDKAYREGRVTTAKTIYELVKLHKKYGPEVAKWCKGNESITRGTVKALANELKQPEKQPDLSLDSPNKETGPNTAPERSTPEKGLNSDNPDTFDHPVVVVSISKRAAVIVLDRKPSKQGRAWVQFRDDNSLSEVKAGDCTLVEITTIEVSA